MNKKFKNLQTFEQHTDKDLNKSFSFTYNDLKQAFEDGELYGNHELPLLNNFDFSDKPELTAFDVWFDNWFNKNYKK